MLTLRERLRQDLKDVWHAVGRRLQALSGTDALTRSARSLPEVDCHNWRRARLITVRANRCRVEPSGESCTFNRG